MTEPVPTYAWAVLRKDGQIQHLDGGLSKRLAIFGTKADADRDCSKMDEVVVPIEIRVVARPVTKSSSRYGWSSDPTTDAELQAKYGDSVHKPKA